MERAKKASFKKLFDFINKGEFKLTANDVVDFHYSLQWLAKYIQGAEDFKVKSLDRKPVSKKKVSKK